MWDGLNVVANRVNAKSVPKLRRMALWDAFRRNIMYCSSYTVEASESAAGVISSVEVSKNPVKQSFSPVVLMLAGVA